MALPVELPVSVIVVPLPWVKSLPIFRVVLEAASVDELRLNVPPLRVKFPAMLMARVAAAAAVAYPEP
jgi:hypothetical protein